MKLILFSALKTACAAAFILAALGAASTAFAQAATDSVEVANDASKILKIQWFGHSMFRVEVGGSVFLFDPFSDIGYPMPTLPIRCDACIVSHGHFDHNNVKLAGGPFVTLDTEGVQTVRATKVTQIKSFHDKKDGRERGTNLITVLEYDNFRLAHLGDLGQVPEDDIIKKMGKIDVLMIPIGGFYTIDSFDAWETIRLISPKIVIPMHYRTDRIKIAIADPVQFLAGRKNVVKLDSSETAVDISELPKEETIWLFKTP